MVKKYIKGFYSRQHCKAVDIFTIPFMASNALQVLYSTIDMIIVGEYVGTAGLSAVSQSSLIMNFAAMDYLVTCGAGLIFTARYNMVSAVLRGMGD